MNPCTQVTYKYLTDIEGMEDYPDYSIDINGIVWSHKYNKCRRVKYYEARRDYGTYLTTQIMNKNGKKGCFYVHRLVAKAFLPNPNESWGLYHLNGDMSDNRLENLSWLGRKVKRKDNDTEEMDYDRLILSKEMSDLIKQVHYAATLKGIPVPTDFEFFHNMLNESLEEFINRYGLKKTIYQINNEVLMR